MSLDLAKSIEICEWAIKFAIDNGYECSNPVYHINAVEIALHNHKQYALLYDFRGHNSFKNFCDANEDLKPYNELLNKIISNRWLVDTVKKRIDTTVAFRWLTFYFTAFYEHCKSMADTENEKISLQANALAEAMKAIDRKNKKEK